MQGHVTGICVENCNDLGLRLPVSGIVRDELKVKNGRRQVPFKRQVGDAESNLKFLLAVLERRCEAGSLNWTSTPS